MAILCMARPWKHPKTGVYYFRRVIPEGLRPFVPEGDTAAPERRLAKHEYKRSLHTKDAPTAKRLYADAAAICDDYFSSLRAAKERAAATEVGGLASQAAGSRHATPEASATGHPTTFSLRALAAELGQEIIQRNAGAPPAAAFKNNRAIPPGPWGTPREPWASHRYALATSLRAKMRASQHEYVTTPSREFLGARGITLSPDEQQWEEFCELSCEAIDAALETLQRRYRHGDNDTATSDAPLVQRFPVGMPESRPRVAIAPLGAAITGLIETWAKGRENPRQRTRERFARRLEQFSAFLKHDDAMAVTSKDLRRWRDHLRNEGRTAKTVNEDCVAAVTTVFRAASAEEVLPTYPFHDYKALREDKTKENARRPYTEEEARRLLTCARLRTDALRWLPWLMAYTGARIGEVAQLRKEDVRTEHGIKVLRITGGTEKGHEVKTGSSRRDVPLHRAVIDEGFLKYVGGAKEGPLFSDLPPGRLGKRGDAASTEYRRWARGVVGITDKRAVAHSWRHRMEDQLREIEAPEEVAAAITGRTRQGSRAGYGKGPSLALQARWLAKIPAVKLGADTRT
ncbi:MAG: tyrosine-type recombinase/integrase [Rhodospirillales bacterium]|nr:tyrosine-type recombinase/integrase [Rhodospirillales bacterium]